MATSGGVLGPKSVKLDEAQASAKSCAGRPDFLPCDGGQSACATHSHGKCFKLHWCCHLGWCHCKYVYQPMTNVCQLPSTPVPCDAPEHHRASSSSSSSLSASLAERFLRSAPALVAPPPASQTRFCVIAELFVDDYVVKRINGKMCYVQRLPPTPPPKAAQQAPPPAASRYSSPSPRFPPAPTPPKRQSQAMRRPQPRPSDRSPLEDYDKMAEPIGQKSQPCSSPSSSEDSGINAVGGTYTESYDEDEDDDDGEEDEEGDEEEETNSDVESSRGSLWGNEEFSLLAPSRSLVEIIEKIETTV